MFQRQAMKENQLDNDLQGVVGANYFYRHVFAPCVVASSFILTVRSVSEVIYYHYG